jgi:hypothetical protein
MSTGRIKYRELNSKQHTCAGKQTVPQPGMQKSVHERFVQHLVVCQQYLQASKQANKQKTSTHLALDLL